ncbi:Rossmann-like and DUF2520 domain-containing protein [Bacteroidota bacterium]
MRKKIVFLGAGNVATQLSVALSGAGNEIVSIYSRTEKSAQLLGEKINSNYTFKIEEIPSDADIYFLTVPDLVSESLISDIPSNNGMLVHCSGSLDIDIFKNKTKNYGVFYPLQTLSKLNSVNFTEVPVCIEANNTINQDILHNLAKQISTDVRLIDTETRKYLHLAGVFACNFVNHMYSIADNILKDKKIKNDILFPLIEETMKKALSLGPENIQTGPAIRNDKNIIKKHLELLSFYPEFQNLYKILSKSISDYHSDR